MTSSYQKEGLHRPAIWTKANLLHTFDVLLLPQVPGGQATGLDHMGYVLWAVSPRPLVREGYFRLGDMAHGLTRNLGGERGIEGFVDLMATRRELTLHTFVNDWNSYRAGFPLDENLARSMRSVAQEHVLTRRKRQALPGEFTVEQPHLLPASYRALAEEAVRGIGGSYLSEAAFLSPLEGYYRLKDAAGSRLPVAYAQVRELIYWVRGQTHTHGLITPNYLRAPVAQRSSRLVRTSRAGR